MGTVFLLHVQRERGRGDGDERQRTVPLFCQTPQHSLACCVPRAHNLVEVNKANLSGHGASLGMGLAWAYVHSALAQMRQAVVQLKKFRIPATATLMSVLLG